MFHVAGDTAFWRQRNERQRRVNVDGLAIVARACLDYGVDRLIHTSTVDTFGLDPSGGTFDETIGRFNLDGIGYHHGETKHAVDEVVRSAGRQGLDVVLIHPGMMLGPYDHTLQMGRVFFDLKRGDIPGVPAGGGTYCHVGEVALAHVAAVERGRSGQSYIFAGGPHTKLTRRDMFGRMARAVGAHAPDRVLSEATMIACGHLCKAVSAVGHRPPKMNPGLARYMSRPQYAASDRALRNLGYAVPEVEVTIDDALHWHRETGHDL